jgi:hypothetical protein
VKIHDDIGVLVPEVQLPKAGTDLKKWAVIACDQFTSEPEYWHEVEKIVGSAPSTLNLTFPEVYLEAPGKEGRIGRIQASMRKYLVEQLLEPQEGIVYVERSVVGKVRRGLVLALDLECYDYNKGSTSLIRATEGTIVDRLPPRMKIREGAALELPHILVLIDDPDGSVIEPVGKRRGSLRKLYDFDLMLESGHLTGYLLDEERERGVVAALRGLARPESFRARYGIAADKPVLLFAMGDGNHSLATAKAVWEKTKPQAGMDHPARYALVEIENVHDQGLHFAPIHRALFNLKRDLLADLRSQFGRNLNHVPVATTGEMIERVDASRGERHTIGLVLGGPNPSYGLIEISHPSSNLPVGTLQAFLDPFIKDGGAGKIDYVHGGEVVVRLGSQPGNAAFYLPPMGKSSLFKTVILDGVLPRKTFSMGEAREKRFYMEARQIA